MGRVAPPDTVRLWHRDRRTADAPGDIDRARVKLVASGSNSPGAMICYEAGYEGFWLYRRLIALGIRVVVIDPASLLVDRRAKRAKTDRIPSPGVTRLQRYYEPLRHPMSARPLLRGRPVDHS